MHSSIGAQFKPHLRRWSEVELPEVALTESDVSHVTGSGTDRNRKSRKWSRAHAQPVPALFSYYSSTQCSTVVQGPWLPEVIEGHVTPKGVPWKGVRMRNRKLHNINPSRAFSPEVTEGHLTQKGFPWNWKLGVFSRTSASYNLIIFTGYLPLVFS